MHSLLYKGKGRSALGRGGRLPRQRVKRGKNKRGRNAINAICIPPVRSPITTVLAQRRPHAFFTRLTARFFIRHCSSTRCTMGRSDRSLPLGRLNIKWNTKEIRAIFNDEPISIIFFPFFFTNQDINKIEVNGGIEIVSHHHFRVY